MEANPDIAKGVCGKTRAKKRWEMIATELNGHGPPVRTWEKWLKFWTDYKFKIKKKKSQNKLEMKATGGGPNKLHIFSQLEESVSSLLEMNTYVDPPGIEFGQSSDIFPANVENRSANISISNIESDVELNLTPPICTANDIPSSMPDKKSSKVNKREENDNALKNRLVLLEKQTNIQESFYKNMIDIMQDIKTRCKNTEEYAKQTYYLQKDANKELFATKKEKLEIYRNEVKCKQRDRAIKLKVKQEILELQKDLLDK